jgi:hypothetical protein
MLDTVRIMLNLSSMGSRAVYDIGVRCVHMSAMLISLASRMQFGHAVTSASCVIQMGYEDTKRDS